MVPNGKWIGKQFGDQYPAEDALMALGKHEEFESHDGPGGRRFALDQVGDEEKILESLREENTKKVKHQLF